MNSKPILVYHGASHSYIEKKYECDMCKWYIHSYQILKDVFTISVCMNENKCCDENFLTKEEFQV